MPAFPGSHFDAHSADPAVHAAAVVFDTDFANASTALFLSAAAAANLQVIMLGGETVTFVFAAAFTGVFPIRVTRVVSAGTTFVAANVMNLWR